jgi:hypothetical protein
MLVPSAQARLARRSNHQPALMTIPAATVSFDDSSIRMKLPVVRLRE